jgi:hypothetical protein
MLQNNHFKSLKGKKKYKKHCFNFHKCITLTHFTYYIFSEAMVVFDDYKILLDIVILYYGP